MGKLLDNLLNAFYTDQRMRLSSFSNLDNRTAFGFEPYREEDKMAKRIKREVVINGVKRWVTGNTEQEYAENLMRIITQQCGSKSIQPGKHNFRAYAKNWFVTYSKPNIETVTANTYQRQLTVHIFPLLGDMNVEDITPDDIQKLFNSMDCAKTTKDKTRTVLNMIFDMAVDDEIISKNPVQSKRLRITGKPSEPTEEYSIDQMQYLIAHISDVKNLIDRRYLAIQALHPLRLEEVLGLKWEDVDRENMVLHIRRAVTHPSRNAPEVKEPKTKASIRTIALSRLALEHLGEGEGFVIGGEKPFSYTQVRGMCRRIQRDTSFDGKITPIRFRTTVLTDIYDQTRDIKQAQAAAGHTTAAMTLRYYVKGRSSSQETANAVERAYTSAN